jgi:hypothetical protein
MHEPDGSQTTLALDQGSAEGQGSSVDRPIWARIPHLDPADRPERLGNPGEKLNSYFHPPFGHTFTGAIVIRCYPARDFRSGQQSTPGSSGKSGLGDIGS